MSAADSDGALPARPEPRVPASTARYLFVVGCARSGTTWLQLLLSQHPGVATSQETHLFSRYISRLEHGWRFEHDAKLNRRRGTGLAAVLGDDEFYALCRGFAVQVLDRILAGNPNARVVLEKTPSHVRYAKLIRRVLPDAYFLHMVRDPRAVVASLRGAGRSWARHWAPTNAAAGTRMWCEDLRAGRAIGDATGRYREVSYEALSADGAAELAHLLQWLELPADETFCREAVAACDIDRLRRGDGNVRSPWSLGDEPAGFYRKGSVRGWMDDLTASDVAVIEHIAGSLMHELGYERVTRRRRPPFRLALRDALSWRLRGVHTWLGRRIRAL